MKSTNPLRYVLVLVPMLAALVVMPSAFADATSNAVVLDEPFAFSLAAVVARGGWQLVTRGRA